MIPDTWSTRSTVLVLSSASPIKITSSYQQPRENYPSLLEILT